MSTELETLTKESVVIARYAKTDVRYWQSCLFQAASNHDGKKTVGRDWSVKIQHLGRRETFGLATPNKAVAAGKARDIFLSLKGAGWDATLAKYKPKAKAKTQVVTTVGDFLQAVVANTGGNRKTVEAYCRAFRTIVADAVGLKEGKQKYDARKGGRAAWLAKVHDVKLAAVTPQRVQAWKIRFLRRADDDPLRQRTARISVNSLLRQAKSLFAPDRLKFIDAKLPDPLPFSGIQFEPRPSMRYRGSFDVERVIADAQRELPTEQLKIFLLAGLAGLRRNEIDKLEWVAFRWEVNSIRIDTTAFIRPKSEDSAGDVEVDVELMDVFRRFANGATTGFVVESQVPPRLGATYSHYRCERHFKRLMTWLRAHGVIGPKPLHNLRKEYGSQVCAKHGIYAASQALRHSDIAITSQHYLDRRRRATADLGRLLAQQPEDAAAPKPPTTAKTGEVKKGAA